MPLDWQTLGALKIVVVFGGVIAWLSYESWKLRREASANRAGAPAERDAARPAEHQNPDRGADPDAQ